MADVRVVEALLEASRTGVAVKLAPWERQQRPDLSQLINKPPVRKPETVRAPSPSIG